MYRCLRHSPVELLARGFLLVGESSDDLGIGCLFRLGAHVWTLLPPRAKDRGTSQADL